MASLREIKKDINYLVYEVVSDCYTFIYLNPGKKEDKALEIIHSITEFRNVIINKVNHPPKEKSEIKKYYQSLYNELLETIDAAFQNLSKLTK